jgi:hypothetical protein
MKKLLLFTFFIVLCLCDLKLRKIGTFRTPNPAFMKIENLPTTSSKPALIITSFGPNPFSSGDIRVVENIGSQLSQVQRIQPKLIARGFQWPNEAERVPFNVFNENYISYAGIFIFKKRWFFGSWKKVLFIQLIL